MSQQQQSSPVAKSWAEQSVGERIVATAWRAVAAHLAMADDLGPDEPTAGQQVATGGAGDHDGVTDDALLPAAIRERLR